MKSRLAGGLFAFPLLIVGACGGSTFTSATGSGGADGGAIDSGGTSDDGGSNDSGGITDGGASDSGGVIPCPATLPQPQTSCAPEGRVCAYGDDPRVGCRPTATCSNGAWSVAATSCPAIPPETCPADRASASGQSCKTQGAYCTYDQGLSCECTSCPPSGPLCNPQAGPRWYCESPNPTPSCPAAVPNLGTACAPDQLECDYGCGTERGRLCEAGVWVAHASGPCPVSMRRAKRDIQYASDAELQKLEAEVRSTHVATYEYIDPALAGHRHLGFIIEDQPAQSFAVDPERSQVDLYGYTSMVVATVQLQAKKIDALEREVKAMREELARQTRKPH